MALLTLGGDLPLAARILTPPAVVPPTPPPSFSAAMLAQWACGVFFAQDRGSWQLGSLALAGLGVVLSQQEVSKKFD